MKTVRSLSIIILLVSALTVIQVAPIKAAEIHQVFYTYFAQDTAILTEDGWYYEFNGTSNLTVSVIWGSPVIFAFNSSANHGPPNLVRGWCPYNADFSMSFPSNNSNPLVVTFPLWKISNYYFNGLDCSGFTLIVRPDLVNFAPSYGAKQTDPHFSAQADFNGDGRISLSDLVSLAKLYQQRINWTGPLPNSISVNEFE